MAGLIDNVMASRSAAQGLVEAIDRLLQQNEMEIARLRSTTATGSTCPDTTCASSSSSRPVQSVPLAVPPAWDSHRQDRPDSPSSKPSRVGVQVQATGPLLQKLQKTKQSGTKESDPDMSILWIKLNVPVWKVMAEWCWHHGLTASELRFFAPSSSAHPSSSSGDENPGHVINFTELMPEDTAAGRGWQAGHVVNVRVALRSLEISHQPSHDKESDDERIEDMGGTGHAGSIQVTSDTAHSSEATEQVLLFGVVPQPTLAQNSPPTAVLEPSPPEMIRVPLPQPAGSGPPWIDQVDHMDHNMSLQSAEGWHSETNNVPVHKSGSAWSDTGAYKPQRSDTGDAQSHDASMSAPIDQFRTPSQLRGNRVAPGPEQMQRIASTNVAQAHRLASSNAAPTTLSQKKRLSQLSVGSAQVPRKVRVSTISSIFGEEEKEKSKIPMHPHKRRYGSNDSGLSHVKNKTSQNSQEVDAILSERASPVRAAWHKAIFRAKFIAKVKKRSKGMQEETTSNRDDDDEPEYFWLHDQWHNTRLKSQRRTMTSIKALDCDGRDSHPDAQQLAAMLKKKPIFLVILERLMLHPFHPFRVFWDSLGLVMFMYDAVMLPLQFFPLPDIWFLLLMGWMVRVYWTIDVPLSFITGRELMLGTVEMNPKVIAQKYLMSWFILDIPLVIVDWMEIIQDDTGENRELGIARIGKMARNMRMLRMFRLFKIIHTIKIPEELQILTQLRSESMLIVLGIVKILIVVMWCSHFIGCFWYAIGRMDYDSKLNWLTVYGMETRSTWFVYMASFYWSVALFTGAQDMDPQNTVERLFAVFVILFVFVLSAYAVSSITTSMTKLQIVTAKTSTQFTTLRTYLNFMSIPKPLAMRVQKSAQAAVEMESKNMREDQVELLFKISEPLRVEVHYQINSPPLRWHPFFDHYDRVCRAGMRQICHSCFTELTLHRGDLLFSSGEMPDIPKMFFVMSGKLLYIHRDVNPKNVLEGYWLCEAVLWTNWFFHGTMRAKQDSRILLLDAQKFQKVTTQFVNREGANPVDYAREYVKRLNETKKSHITDLEDTYSMNVADIVKKAYGEGIRRRASIGLNVGEQVEGDDD